MEKKFWTKREKGWLPFWADLLLRIVVSVAASIATMKICGLI